MKTYYLDRQIKLLKQGVDNNTITLDGKEALNEYISIKEQLTIHSVVVTLPPYKECDCVDPLKCYRICHDLIGRSGNAL